MSLRLSLAVALLVFLTAGCGSAGGPPGVARVASTTVSTTATKQNGAAVFVSCMRSHGVVRYPVNGKPTPQQVGVTKGQFETAVDACRHLLPNGGRTTNTQQTRVQLADELSFAKCMRRDGVSGFPDPTPQQGLTVEMVAAHGIDVHSQAVLRVVQRCLPAAHGGLTAAQVREAIQNAGG
jgi:hypothetical protein